MTGKTIGSQGVGHVVCPRRWTGRFVRPMTAYLKQVFDLPSLSVLVYHHLEVVTKSII